MVHSARALYATAFGFEQSFFFLQMFFLDFSAWVALDPCFCFRLQLQRLALVLGAEAHPERRNTSLGKHSDPVRPAGPSATAARSINDAVDAVNSDLQHVPAFVSILA